ncbi:uncharacterized protein RAG0_06311 [Rhynchosporium agropyri]|uniref:Uncharacterized protein n=3 Tax=Rhynchosporium TaxID=38037 RepID=A0A1E1MPT4_RHYSE|nr:uncharacterized protein RAG0_06311 [Rhynchosporium agropyri]CZT03207.1 uncharacterized protein RCO7_14715 [Rhynchosporium commune]CZT51108.1 uncharacterized protein RSE6_12196 [Rhynchosporium secalis]
MCGCYVSSRESKVAKSLFENVGISSIYEHLAPSNKSYIVSDWAATALHIFGLSSVQTQAESFRNKKAQGVPQRHRSSGCVPH